MPRPAPRTKPRTGPRSTGAVLVRLSPEERERLRAAADRTGVGIGPWLRMLGLREAAREGER